MADTLLIIKVRVYRGRYSIAGEGGTGLTVTHEMASQVLNGGKKHVMAYSAAIKNPLM